MADGLPPENWGPVPTTQKQKDILLKELDDETERYDSATDPEAIRIHGRNIQKIARNLQNKRVEGVPEDHPFPERRPKFGAAQGGATGSWGNFEDFGPVAQDAPKSKSIEFLKGLGGETAAIADTIWGMATMPISVGAQLSSTAIGLATGDGVDAYQKGRKIGHQVNEWIGNPLQKLLHLFDSGKVYEEAATTKGMQYLTELIESADEYWHEKSGGKIPKGSVAMMAETLMVGAMGKGAPDAVKSGWEAARGKLRERYGKGKPSDFNDFTPQDIERNPDAFIADTLKKEAEQEKKNAAAKKFALVSSGAAVGAGAGYAYQQYQEANKPPAEPLPNERGNYLAAPDLNQIGPAVLGMGIFGMRPRFERGRSLANRHEMAVKEPGGMWHPEAVERLAEPLKDKLAGTIAEGGSKDFPSSQTAWADRAIRNYLNKYAGTTRDPLKDVEVPFGEGVKRWEELTDTMLGKLQADSFNPMPQGARSGETVHYIQEHVRPLAEGVTPRTTTAALTSYLSHVGDYLRQNVAPEKLAQYDLVRAVRETAANDARMARESAKAAQASMKDLPVHKEYPTGFKWVELKKPEKLTEEQAKGIRPLSKGEFSFRNSQPGLAAKYAAIDASGKDIVNSYTGEGAFGRTPEEAHLAGQLAQEGNQMSHCVGGYCEPVASGESRIYSLRGPDGKSHVTVEVGKEVPAWSKNVAIRKVHDEYTALHEQGKQPGDFTPWLSKNYPELMQVYKEALPDILQIKGKANRAPNKEYLPYVQDFVKGGKWGEVHDLQNTGLNDIKPSRENSVKFRQLADELYPDQRFLDEAQSKHLQEEGIKRTLEERDGKQQGFTNLELQKLMAAAGIGATVGVALSDADRRLWGALFGGGAAAALAAMGRSGGKARTPLESLDYGLGVISTRLRNISEPLRFRAVDYERRTLQRIHDAFEQVHPFLKSVSKMPAAIKEQLNTAIISNDITAINKAFAASGNKEIYSQWKQVREYLNKIGEEWQGKGRIKELLADYFPRIVKDVPGLMQALGKETGAALSEVLKDANLEAVKERGTPLSQLEESIIINRTLQQWRRGSGVLDQARSRRIQEVTPDLAKFYADPAEALHSYISTVSRDLEKARFFGKDLAERTKNGKTYLDLDTSIGNVVREELNAGRIDDAQAADLQSIIKSRFTTGEAGSTGWVQDVRNMANAGLLGNVASAAIQFSDAAVAVYLHGFRPAFGSIIRNLTGTARVSAKDFGLIDHIAEEFASTRTSQKFLNGIFKASGFAAIDRFGKNVVLNAALSKYEGWARTEAGRKQIAKRYGESLGEELPQLYKDLQEGKQTDLVNSVLFAELSDAQPVSRMEVPQGYLDHPNGRVLYMLKTYMIKQMDIVRRDAYNEIKKGNPESIARGVKNLAAYATVLGIAGATTDQVKNWILGKNDPLEGRDVYMNVLKTFGLSEYFLNDAKKQGVTKAVWNSVMPPYKMMEEIVKADPKAVRYIPVIGPILQSRLMGGGQKATEGKQVNDMMRLVDPETQLRQKRLKEAKDQLYQQYSRGDKDGFKEGLRALQKEHKLTEKQVESVRKNAALPADIRKFKSLPLDQQRDILKNATPEQRDRLRKYANKKLREG